jgi:hypothetical protein
MRFGARLRIVELIWIAVVQLRESIQENRIMTVAQVLQQAKALSPTERKELVKSLIDLIASDAQRPKRRLSELQGLGKEIWQGIDAQEYIDELRDEWDKER